jgi:hypothetical protein
LKSLRPASAVAWWTIASGLVSTTTLRTARVEQVEHDRLCPQRVQAFGLVGRAGGADHLVASVDELRDEPGADGAARPRDEDSHRVCAKTPGQRAGRRSACRVWLGLPSAEAVASRASR